MQTELNDRQRAALSFITDAAAYSSLLQDELIYLHRRIEDGDLYDLLRTPSENQQAKFQRLIEAQTGWAEQASEEAKAAVESYHRSGWRQLNAGLRHGSKLSGQAAADHHQLQKLFSTVAPTAEPLLVSRGLQLDEAADFGFTSDQIRDAHSQTVITEQGYLSTGANLLRLGPSGEQISLLLEIPKESHVLSIGAFRWDMDQEIVLPPETKMRVLGRRIHDHGGMSIFARAIT